MSKKKKKNKKLKYFGSEKKQKKNSKGKKRSGKSAYGKPKMKSVKPTLSKKEAKENKKIVMAPVDVPKEFRKNRLKCNHAADTITVDRYKALTPSWAAYTPALERMVEQFGPEHVCVCKDCYDILVDRDCVSAEDVYTALTTLYAACNIAVSNRRLKDDEVKAIAKLKEVLNDFAPVLDILGKIAEEEGRMDTSSTGADLNDNSAFVDP